MNTIYKQSPLLPICAEDAPQNTKTLRLQSGRSMIEMLGVLAIVGVLSVGGIAGYSKAMQKYRVNKTIDQITQISNGIHTLYTARNNYEGLSIDVLGKAKVIPQELIDYSESKSHPQSYNGVPIWDYFNEKNDAIENCEDRYCRNLNYDECDRGPCKNEYTRWQEAYSIYHYGLTIQTFYGTNPFDGKIILSVEDNAKAFSLNYLGLPEDACIEVLTQDWGTTDLIAVGVDSSITSAQGCTGIKGTHVCNDQLPVSVEKAMTLCEQQTDSKGVILKFK